jgi:hypothetical protein
MTQILDHVSKRQVSIALILMTLGGVSSYGHDRFNATARKAQERQAQAVKVVADPQEWEICSRVSK